jgi:UTP--glucose-1-phosphate uridylyltransferase
MNGKLRMKAVTKAVFPVAWLGAQFLPATKAMPKELLPISDKPILQYAVEEAIVAGITELVFVTDRTKRAIAHHFDASPELKRELHEKCKDDLADAIHSIIPDHVNCILFASPAPWASDTPCSAQPP